GRAGARGSPAAERRDRRTRRRRRGSLEQPSPKAAAVRHHRCRRRPSGEGQELALKLQDAALNVVQHFIRPLQLTLDFGGAALLAFAAAEGGEIEQAGKEPAQATKKPYSERRRPLALGLIRARGFLSPQQRATQKSDLPLLVPQLLQGGLRLGRRPDGDADGGAVDFYVTHWRKLHGRPSMLTEARESTRRSGRRQAIHP